MHVGPALNQAWEYGLRAKVCGKYGIRESGQKAGINSGLKRAETRRKTSIRSQTGVPKCHLVETLVKCAWGQGPRQGASFMG